MDAYSMFEAESADAEAILDIDRNVYCGRDYLPYCIKYWIDESEATRRNFVLKERGSGRIVAYLSVGLQKEGSMGIIQGARVVEDLRGQGLLHKLTILAQEFIWRINPLTKLYTAIEKTAIPYIEKRYAELGKSITNPYGEVSSTTSYMYFDPGTCSALESALAVAKADTEPPPDLENMDMESFRNVLVANEVLKETVIVNGNLIVDFIPYPLDDLSSVSMFCTSALAMASATNTAASVVSLPYRCPAGLRVIVDLYGKDLDEAYAHMLAQFAFVVNYVKQHFGSSSTLFILVVCDDSLNPSLLLRASKHFSAPMKEAMNMREDGKMPTYAYLEKTNQH